MLLTNRDNNCKVLADSKSCTLYIHKEGNLQKLRYFQCTILEYDVSNQSYGHIVLHFFRNKAMWTNHCKAIFWIFFCISGIFTVTLAEQIHSGDIDVEREHFENEVFHFEDFFLCVSIIRDVHKLRHLGRVNFFIFTETGKELNWILFSNNTWSQYRYSVSWCLIHM